MKCLSIKCIDDTYSLELIYFWYDIAMEAVGGGGGGWPSKRQFNLTVSMNSFTNYTHAMVATHGFNEWSEYW